MRFLARIETVCVQSRRLFFCLLIVSVLATALWIYCVSQNSWPGRTSSNCVGAKYGQFEFANENVHNWIMLYGTAFFFFFLTASCCCHRSAGVTTSYNKRQEDFSTLPEYNDYFEEVEEISKLPFFGSTQIYPAFHPLYTSCLVEHSLWGGAFAVHIECSSLVSPV